MPDYIQHEIDFAAFDLTMCVEENDPFEIVAAARRFAAWRRVAPHDYQADPEFRDEGLYEEGECLGRAEY